MDEAHVQHPVCLVEDEGLDAGEVDVALVAIEQRLYKVDKGNKKLLLQEVLKDESLDRRR